MTRLINLNEFQRTRNHAGLDPKLYFADAKIHGINGIWQFTIKNNYPYVTYVDKDIIEKNPIYLIELRRFVERLCSGDVIYQYLNMTYDWQYNETNLEWQKKYMTINHGYYELFFENQSDQIQFELTYSDGISRTAHKLRQNFHDELTPEIEDKCYRPIKY